jgi:RES domain-containing protein
MSLPEAIAEVLGGSKVLKTAIRRFLVLRGPSIVVPEEFNYLINPHHPDFASIKIARAKPFTFDPRLWK